MPRRHSPLTLRRYSMMSLAKNWDLVCYAASSVREMNSLIEDDSYLMFEGPFVNMPSCILEDLMEVIRSKMSLNRKYLHLLILEQLQTLNLSLGIGEVYYGLQFLPRCKRIRDLNLSYLRHVEPNSLIKIIPHLSSLGTLNLTMTSTIDPVLDLIAYHCPNLIELNLTSTNISDQGLQSLCGIGVGDGTKGCLKLQRLLITETRATWVGAVIILKHLTNLTDFDFEKIFQVFEHLDSKAMEDDILHPKLKIKSLFSTTPCVRGDSIDTAVTLCPNVEILSVMNAWMDNDTFYKFMQFENLRSLTISNAEGMTIDYEEGVLPILQVIGSSLENIILNRFASVDLVSLGRSCPKLRKIALSGIGEFSTNNYVVIEGIYRMLTILELWSNEKTDTPSEHALRQLLVSSAWIESILIKNADDINTSFFRKIWKTNPMHRLNRLILVECNNIEVGVIEELLLTDNDLETIRVWSCPKVQLEEKQRLQELIRKDNLKVYLEWFA